MDHCKNIEFDFCYNIFNEFKNKPYAYSFHEYNKAKKPEVSDSNFNIIMHPMYICLLFLGKCSIISFYKHY